MPGVNIILILVDDHAQWAAHCYGNSEIKTPTLDYLAATGVRMQNAFTPTPVCSPARATLLTGRIASQHGIHDYLADDYDTRAGSPWLADERTLAQILSEAGYVVALSGKWHLGGASQRQPGFDFWYAESKFSPDNGRSVASRQAVDWPHVVAGTPATAQRPGPHAITDYAIDFLRTRDGDRPFFLLVGYTSTHSPWVGQPERLVSQYRPGTFADVPPDPMYRYGAPARESTHPSRHTPRETLAQYYAAVSAIDEQVGRLVDELEAQQIRATTLVIYTSDHGLNMGHHGVWGKGNGTRPLNMLEESIRVPMIINQPDTIFGGQVRDEMITHSDTFHTILEHAGVTVPEDEQRRRRYPGRSFRPLLVGQSIPDWPEVVYGEYGDLRMVRTARFKLIRRPAGPSELFDLAADPRETRSCLDDPELQPIVVSLMRMIDEFFGFYEEPAKSGLRVAELAPHNSDETWRRPVP